MTASQRVHLLGRLWPNTCRCQGWNANDRAKRLEVLSQAVGRHLTSASQLSSTEDFDQVKAHLGMLADNLAATVETIQPEQGRARRLRAVIRRQLAELGQFGGDPGALLAAIVADKFAHGLAASAPTLDDLTAVPTFRTDPRTGEAKEGASQLDQVLFTLARIVSQRRRAARLAQTERVAA